VTCKYILCESQTINYRSLDKYILHTRVPLRIVYTEKNRLIHTKWIASKRKYIMRGAEMIIPVLFQKIYKSCPHTYPWN